MNATRFLCRTVAAFRTAGFLVLGGCRRLQAKPQVSEFFTEPQSISFVGLADEHMGVACWIADGSGKESAKDPPPLTTPRGEIKHLYHGASPDYDGIAPESPGGLRATEAVCRFTRFMAALRQEGYRPIDLVANIPFYTPTEDTAGWSYENDIEKRYLQRHGPTVNELRVEPIFGLWSLP